jgi:hypothetical protein
MRMGWVLFLLLIFWSIVIQWIVLPHMSRNGLCYVLEPWPNPMSSCEALFILVGYHILQCINASWFFDSKAYNPTLSVQSI